MAIGMIRMIIMPIFFTSNRFERRPRRGANKIANQAVFLVE